jgi:hypothetical protein
MRAATGKIGKGEMMLGIFSEFLIINHDEAVLGVPA